MDNLLTISNIKRITLTNKNQETISHSKCNRRNDKKVILGIQIGNTKLLY